MKIGFHDIHKLPADGYLVFPLSMSRLAAGQDPEACYAALDFFGEKIVKAGLDVVFLYTNGLYYNNEESAFVVRKRTNEQMLSHRNALYKRIVKGRRYVPQAIHFLPWDYILLNSIVYSDFYARLHSLFISDSIFRSLVLDGLRTRGESEANVNFLLEEIVVTHLLREDYVELPKTLVKNNNFRLVIYPGAFFKADWHQWKNKILPLNKNCENVYRSGHYNLDEKLLCDFSEVEEAQIYSDK